MLKNSQRGFTNPMLISLMLAVFLTIVMTGVSIWAYTNYVDQRDNVDSKIEDAVAVAEEAKETELEADFAEREKSPTKTYQGPVALGSVTVKYPKTWSAYVEERESGGKTGLDAYFHPRFVPDLDSDTLYALRIELTDDSYARELETYQKQIEKKEASSSPVKFSGVQGVRIDGQYEKDKQGTIVVLPLRDKTLKVFTESNDFVSDFNKIILKNLKFIP